MLEAPTEITTNRLTLRPPVGSDRALWVRLHRDPALWEHSPHAMPRSDEVAAAGFEDCMSRWGSAGFDYAVVEESQHRTGVGVGGIRRSDSGHQLLLDFRLDASVHRRGLAREACRAWTGHAVEWLPALPLVALVKEHDAAAVHTALSVGMERSGAEALEEDLAGDPPSVLYTAPTVQAREWFDDATRESVLDLWCAVNEAGGAVGFLPGASRAQVSQALAAHEEEMAEGQTVAVLLRAPGGAVVGLGFWVSERGVLLGHAGTAYRIMTDPARRGRNLGRLLLAAMHRIARERGAELATVVVRSGLGITRFYERAGYVEVGRVPGTIRVAPGDDRDSVFLTRRLDGRPMVADGRA